MTQTNLYGYALILPGRDPLYLPLTTRPPQVGYERNITLRQSPGTEVAFRTGDTKRKITPLQLTGSVLEADLPEASEDGARLYLERLDNMAAIATGLQRGQTVDRELLGGGYFIFGSTSSPLEWTFTLTLFPSGPSAFDELSRPVPF